MTLLHPLEKWTPAWQHLHGRNIAEHWSKRKKGTILATLMAKESYRYDQATPADPPQANFFRQLPLPRADGLDKVLQNFLVILL
jgi:hypothetical protein